MAAEVATVSQGWEEGKENQSMRPAVSMLQGGLRLGGICASAGAASPRGAEHTACLRLSQAEALCGNREFTPGGVGVRRWRASCAMQRGRGARARSGSGRRTYVVAVLVVVAWLAVERFEQIQDRVESSHVLPRCRVCLRELVPPWRRQSAGSPPHKNQNRAERNNSRLHVL